MHVALTLILDGLNHTDTTTSSDHSILTNELHHNNTSSDHSSFLSQSCTTKVEEVQGDKCK